ncbi:SDR family NAD(P)-dependent oxidoreductase [Bacteroides reticulotermitis]|mgnify:FL=1|uniref:Retinol dehydrogenase n=3 Tax=Bacteroides reticulotermitis TaxID=1133319 RepID=W4UUX0_9BACE|nr:SDR family NAD(P)-dependent oxidoreductase [Bacteroides reticulotermitis]MBB4042371.1 NAD(P)-dependent dehydrogenase (short-subunit alcohol dehydrogenase family) [Bacteroides reticulotermitis]GAE85005.1 retinol dehydrogenase [Bacteroides reticulotermitis JCM 10512]
MEQKYAIITGASGGMGVEITRAVAKAGYSVIMVCYRAEKAEAVRKRLLEEEGALSLEIMLADLSSMESVHAFVGKVAERGITVSLLMNNAATMETGLHLTSEGWERTVAVNYLAPYLLTRELLPLMRPGSRIVNMVSCTYVAGRLDYPSFFSRGRKGSFRRLSVYSNTKLALLLFTLRLADELQPQGITVNAADPGVVSTDMITMRRWFDPLTDLFFRPFIRTPKQGAATAVGLLLDEDVKSVTGKLYADCRQKALAAKYGDRTRQDRLWEKTERLLKRWLS